MLITISAIISSMRDECIDAIKKTATSIHKQLAVYYIGVVSNGVVSEKLPHGCHLLTTLLLLLPRIRLISISCRYYGNKFTMTRTILLL